MPLKPCLDCRRLFNPGPSQRGPSNGGVCSDCRRVRDRVTLQAKRERRPYTAGERNRRAATVTAWREQYGDWCPGYNTPPHPSADLTADHPVAVARGGAEDQPLTVLCRSCNARKHAA